MCLSLPRFVWFGLLGCCLIVLCVFFVRGSQYGPLRKASLRYTVTKETKGIALERKPKEKKGKTELGKIKNF